MAYSRWRDSYWYTSALTGAPHINESVLFVNPKNGQGRQYTYVQLKKLTLDISWVSTQFPEVPMHYLSQLLFFIHAFLDDMRANIYRYQGHKEPVPFKATDSDFPLLTPRVVNDELNVLDEQQQQHRP